ncbi:hypothetical protein N9E70_00950 [bacterium]|nr:hypothetical protein [bacterium]
MSLLLDLVSSPMLIAALAKEELITAQATALGFALANVICKPIAEELEGYSGDEVENCELIMEGIAGIQSGLNHGSLSDLMVTRCSPAERARLAAAEADI